MLRRSGKQSVLGALWVDCVGDERNARERLGVDVAAAGLVCDGDRGAGIRMMRRRSGGWGEESAEWHGVGKAEGR